MKEYFPNIIKGDKVIWAIFATFCIISLVEVYSAGSILTYKSGQFWRTFTSQASLLCIGVVAVWFVHNIHCRFFRRLTVIAFPFVVLGLIWALLGGEVVNGGARWVRIPFTSLTIQPSEFAKGELVAIVALILATNQEKNGANKGAFSMILVFSAIICLLIMSQNLSTAGLLFVVICQMMIIGRVPWSQWSKLVGLLVVGASIFFTVLISLPKDPHHEFYQTMVTQRFSTWRARLTESDMDTKVKADSFLLTDHNRQEVHALIAIARAEGIGCMPGNSIERDFLAQADSDFIYAIIAEETGLFGAGLVLALYIILLIRAGRIANACKRNFPAFLVMGLALLLVTQATLNMMVAVGLFPVTGQTLPLISRGGTSTVITCVYFGMILSISNYAEQEKNRMKANKKAEARTDELLATPDGTTLLEAVPAEEEVEQKG